MSLPRGQSSHQRHFSRSMVLSWGTLRAGGLHGIDRRGPGQRDVLHKGSEAPLRGARADTREFFGWGLQRTRNATCVSEGSVSRRPGWSIARPCAPLRNVPTGS